MESCKLRLEAVMQSTGIHSKGATEASPSTKHSDHTAAFKLQAAQQQESKRAKAAQNAINEKEATASRKMEAFKAAENEAYLSPSGAKKRRCYNAG